jgi:hypothetical protein
MDLIALRRAFVLLAALLQFGCATTAPDTSADNPPELTPVPGKEDDSHGWGANLKGM